MRIRSILTLALLLATMAPSAEAARETRGLDGGWSFRFGEAAGWMPVTLPHSWNRLGGAPAAAAERDVRRGAGWYRLNFDGPDLRGGRRAFLQFDGAGTVAEIWLNGVRLGRHEGAYSRFRFDATDALKSGRNELLVRTDNSPPDAPNSPTREVIPISGDWFMFGGLYRNVSMILTEPVHFELLDHGSPGIAVETLEIGADGARVRVRSNVRNDSGSARRFRIQTEILDAAGAAVAQSQAPASLGARQASAAEQMLEVPKPRLWDGVRDPYLYRVRVSLLDAQGRRLDQVEQPLGIRGMQLDPQRGFILNGRITPLRGVALHQDRAGKGWAVSRADREEDFKLIREVGANSVRLSHYQHDEHAYELADRLGLVVWTEIPFVNRASPEGVEETTPGFRANAETQLRELIRQTRNHPSVAVWGIGNEVNFDAAFRRKPTRVLPLLEALHKLAKAEDPSRPTAVADCCGAIPGEGPAGSPVGPVPVESVIEAADAYGVNRYFGWYSRPPSFLGEDLDRLRALYPGRPLALTEYGAGGALTQHSDDPRGGPISAFGRPHPEEFQSWLHEQWWPQIEARPYLWASWIWNMFDFASESRLEGDLVDTNDKGLVTYDRATRKDAFFYYKAQWNPEPMAHLTSKRHDVRAYPVAEVKAYSNAPRLTLTVNGQVVGVAPCPGRVCRWPNVRLAAGENRLAVSGEVGGRQVADSALWQRPASETLYAIPAGVVTASGTAERPVGSDAFFEGGTGHNLSVSGRPMPGPFTPMKVSGASRPELAAGWRSGSFQYTLPVPAGRYTLRLHFFEPDEKVAPGQRLFDVAVNGRQVLRAFDVRREAGAAARVIEREFKLASSGGAVKVSFKPVRGAAVVSGIELRAED